VVKEKRTILIFTGYNQRAIVAFLRTIEPLNIPYVLVARNNDDTIFLTEYANKVIKTRTTDELKLTELLHMLVDIRVQTQSGSLWIAPSTEYLNRFLLKNKNALEAQNFIIPLVELELYKLISNKKSFGDLCCKNGIHTPNERQFSEKFHSPYVAKPIQYVTAKNKPTKPYLIENQEQHNQFINLCDQKDFYYQDLILGESYYLLFYFYKDGSYELTTQRNLLQQFGGKSILAAELCELVFEDEIMKYIKLFQDLNFFGLVMIEIRVHNKTPYMIEANPRFWGPSQLFVDGKVNLFESFLYDWELIENKPIMPRTPRAQYFWLGGIVSDHLEGKLPLELDHGHHFNPLQINKEWLQIDVYNRNDTKMIFTKEAPDYV